MMVDSTHERDVWPYGYQISAVRVYKCGPLFFERRSAQWVSAAGGDPGDYGLPLRNGGTLRLCRSTVPCRPGESVVPWRQP
jgi:hypothetical protein